MKRCIYPGVIGPNPHIDNIYGLFSTLQILRKLVTATLREIECSRQLVETNFFQSQVISEKNGI